MNFSGWFDLEGWFWEQFKEVNFSCNLQNILWYVLQYWLGVLLEQCRNPFLSPTSALQSCEPHFPLLAHGPLSPLCRMRIKKSGQHCQIVVHLSLHLPEFRLAWQPSSLAINHLSSRAKGIPLWNLLEGCASLPACLPRAQFPSSCRVLNEVDLWR